MRVIILCIAFSLLIPAISAYHTGANFGCEMRSSCNFNEVCLFSVSSTDGGHAAKCSVYPTKICCNKFQSASVKSSCSPEESSILSISADSGNAHASDFYDPYSLDVCISYDGTLSCRYSKTEPAYHDCVAAMSGVDNAHVGSCSNTSLGALWCKPVATVEGHTLSVEVSGNDTDTIYLDGVGQKSFADLTTTHYNNDSKYLFGMRNNRLYGVVQAADSFEQASTVKQSTTYKMKLQQKAEGSKMFLVFTRGDLEKVRNLADDVAERRRAADNIVFGTTTLVGNKVTIGLQQSRFVDLQGNETLSPGIYELIVRGVKTTAEKEVIEVRKK